MDRTALIFCVVSFGLFVLVSAIAFPLAAKSSSEIEAAATPLAAEDFEDVDLGDFGVVSVLDLVQYYIDNPPPEPEPGAAPKKVRFQGC